jgi:hypothetical protein
VGPTASLDAVTKGRVACPCRESNPCRPSPGHYTHSFGMTVDGVTSLLRTSQIRLPGDGCLLGCWAMSFGIN